MPISIRQRHLSFFPIRMGLAAIILAGWSGCLFSPSKSDSGFALSGRVWDGIAVDSAGSKQSLTGLLRIDFTDEDEVLVQVGNRKGKAPFSVGKSGRMNLGFQDEPLHLVPVEGKSLPAISAWLPDFITKVDRYKEQGANLYLRSSAYPDVILTLGQGDTSVALGEEPNPKTDTGKTVKPNPVDTLPVKPNPIDTPKTPIDTPKVALVLPIDFPVYGGLPVPNVREAAFHQTVKAWAQWSQTKIADYSFDFYEKCACVKLRNGRMTVEGGKVIAYVAAEGLASTSMNANELPRIETLFAQIGLLLTAPHKTGESLRLAFGSFGEPILLMADMNIASAIDDLSFQVSGLTPKPDGKIPPLVPLDELVGKVWTVAMVDPKNPGKPSQDIAQLQFFSDGTWSGSFLCNVYGGTLMPSADGQYAFTIEPQTFLECGERSVIAAFAALLENPVWVLPNSNDGLILASPDGSLMASLKTLLVFR